MQFINKLKNYRKAGYPGIFVLTHEESRFTRELSNLVQSEPTLTIHEWDAQGGLEYIDGPAYVEHPSDTKVSSDLLKYLQNFREKNNIFILKDFHLHFDKVINIRLLRNAWNNLKGLGNMIVFVGHKFAVPAELHKEVQLMDYDLPDSKAIQERLEYIQASINSERKNNNEALAELDETVAEAAVEAAKGMTDNEVENAFALAFIAAKGKFNNAFVEAVFQEKITQLKKNGLLTYMEPNISFDNVGGMQGLKKWLTARKKAYSKDAREYNLPMPKGMLLASVPGTGKSLICKAIAKEFDCPLFALDVGSIFDSLVGNSEKNMREMIKVVESIGKCVILID